MRTGIRSIKGFDLCTIRLHMGNGSVAPTTVREQIEQAGCADARGVYVILLDGPAGEIPWWVGRTVRQTFWRECSSDHVMSHLRDALLQGEGQPLLWLIGHAMHPRGRVDKLAIKTLETAVIGVAYERNPYLLNKYQLPRPLAAAGLNIR